MSAVRTMPNAELLEMHLSYGPGGHTATDEEVWRRFPDLGRAYGRMQTLHQEFTRQRAEAGPIDLDELPPATPGHAEAREAYVAEVERLAAQDARTTSTITLVSALTGDGIPGVDIAELNPAILAYPDVAAWADAQGYGPDAPDECIVVLPPEAGVPEGFESLTVEVTETEHSDYIEQLNESGI